MNRKPFFSVIIPTYNRVHLLKMAMESVLGQTYKDFELIIVDDGSTDNTKDIVKNFTNRYPLTVPPATSSRRDPAEERSDACGTIRYIYQKNKGPAAAKNTGIRKASGKFITFLDSDDRYRTQKLEILHDYIKKLPQAKIFHTDEIWYRNGALLAHKIYHAKPDGFVFHCALRLCCISISTVAIKRELFNELGLFDESLPACEDYEFWLRATHKYPVKLIPKILTIKEGGHPDQQSKKFKTMDTFRIYAIQKLLDSETLNREQRQLACQELKQKCEIYIKGALKRKKIKEVAQYRKIIKNYTEKHVG